MSVFAKIVTPQHGAAWVTGASAGIGRAITLQLAQKGWTVFATARRTDRLETLIDEAQGGHIIPLPGDVTQADQMRDAVDRITRTAPLALAVLNAGVFMPMRAQNFSARTARDMIDVNLGGVCNALDPVLTEMIRRRDGHVAVMASVTGYRGLPGAAPYSASKAGVIALCEALAMDLVDFNVRMTVINPGFVESEATKVAKSRLPFQLSPDRAAQYVVRGLSRPGFEIAFPGRLVRVMRGVGLLPNRAYFAAMRALTGWRP